MHIVVIGNGVAGNSAAKGALRNPDAKVTLIDEDATSYHSACVLPDYISGDIPLERVFLKNYSSARLEQCQGNRVLAIDLSERKVLLA